MLSTTKKAPAIAELLVPFAAFFALYASTISRNLGASHDSITYINAIDAKSDLFHPHHLLYNGLGALWVEIWRALGISADSVLLVSLLDALFGALTLCVFYWLVRTRLGLGRLPALVGTALPAFSFGFWFYSVGIEVYIIPLFFLVLALCLLTSEGAGPRTYAAVGLAHGAAVLFHQVHVLFGLVVVLAALSSRGRGGTPAWRLLASYASVAAPVVAVPYLLVVFGALGLQTPGEAWYWFTSYAHNSNYWNPLAFSTLAEAGVGFGRSVVGGHFAFAVPAIGAAVETGLGGHWLADEAYLVRALDGLEAYALLGVSVLLLLVVVAGVLTGLRSLGALGPRQRRLLWLTVAWFVSYAAFFFFWEPSNVEFWIPQSVCWWLVFLTLWAARGRAETFSRAPVLLISVAVLLFVPNFFGSVILLHDRENDYYYARVSALAEAARPGDLVIVGRSWVLEDYAERYTRADVLSLSSAYERDRASYVRSVRREIEERLANGDRVLVSGEAVDLEPETVETYGEGMTEIDGLWQDYRDDWRSIGSGLGRAYLLDPQASAGPGTIHQASSSR